MSTIGIRRPGNTYDQQTGVRDIKKCTPRQMPRRRNFGWKSARTSHNGGLLQDISIRTKQPSYSPQLMYALPNLISTKNLKKKKEKTESWIHVDQIIPSHFYNVCTWLSRLLWTAANAFWFSRPHFICIMHRQHKLGVPGDH